MTMTEAEANRKVRLRWGRDALAVIYRGTFDPSFRMFELRTGGGEILGRSFHSWDLAFANADRRESEGA
jgi:hypothetical protein